MAASRWGWELFSAFEAHAKLPSGGYSGVKDVRGGAGSPAGVQHDGRMDSFWLAETLKYLFLLFADDGVLPLHEFAFNTEAHPLRLFPEGEGERGGF